jgi:hypothetical protein
MNGGETEPFSRGPEKVPPVMGSRARLPWGVVPKLTVLEGMVRFTL